MKNNKIVFALLALFMVSFAVLILEKQAHEAGVQAVDSAHVSSGAPSDQKLIEANLEYLRQVELDGGAVVAEKEGPGIFTGHVKLSLRDGVVSEEVFKGQVIIAMGGTGSVSSKDGKENHQYDSFVMLPGGRVLEPAAMLGERFEIVDGSWSMPIPETAQFVARISIDGRVMRIVNGRHIRAGADQAELTVAHSEKLEIRAVDSISGTPIEVLDVYSNTTMPTGRLVGWVQAEGAVAPPHEVEIHSLRKSCPAPPSFATVHAESARVPVAIEPFEFPHKLWVRSDGYQWESVDVSQGSESMTIPLRRTCRLQIQVKAEGWRASRLSLIVRRGGSILAKWKGIGPSSPYLLSDLGAGELLVELVWKGKDFRRVLRSEYITLNPDVDNFALLESKKAESEWDTSLEVHVAGGASSLEQAGLIVQPTIKVYPISDNGQFVLGRGQQKLIAELERNIDQEGVLICSNLAKGDYIVALKPFGIRRRITLAAGKKTVVRIEVPEVARINIWPESEGLPEDSALDISSVNIVWERLDDRTGINFKSAWSNSIPELTSDGCWIIRTTPGRVKYYLVDPTGRVLHSEVVDVVDGFSDTVAKLNGDGVSMAQISITGLSPAEFAVCKTQVALGVSGDTGGEIWPVVNSFKQTGDLEYSVELSYAIPKEWVNLSLVITTPISPISFDPVPGASTIKDGTMHIGYRVRE